jgi:hypothetical protein
MRFNARFLTRSFLCPVSLSPDIRHFAGTIMLPGSRNAPSPATSAIADIPGLKVRRQPAVIRLNSIHYLTPGAGPMTQKLQTCYSDKTDGGSVCPVAWNGVPLIKNNADRFSIAHTALRAGRRRGLPGISLFDTTLASC